VSSIKAVFITFLFLMSFSAYAASCPFTALPQANPAAQLQSNLTATPADSLHGSALCNVTYDHNNEQLKQIPLQKIQNKQTALVQQKKLAEKQQGKLKGAHLDLGLNGNAYLFSEYLHQPLYLLEIEFSPPHPPTQKSTLSLSVNDYSPWFLSSPNRNRTRISGWKDGNTLYSGSITYYS